MKKKDEFPGIYNLSPDDFVALMAGAKQATGLSEQEIMDGLKELVDKGYIHVVDENGTFSIVLPGDDLPGQIKRAMRNVFADTELTLEQKMVHNYCAEMVQRASGVVSINAMSYHLGFPSRVIWEGLRVLKERKHIDYVVNGDTCAFTLLHALGATEET